MRSQLESSLPYPIDVVIGTGTGDWFLAYDQAEGFQPFTYAIRADNEDDAADVWSEQRRHAGADTEQLVVVPLRRNR